MKSEEEYLIKYEESLIGKLSDGFNSLNKYIIICFSLLFVFLLYFYDLIQEASIEGNKLTLSKEQSALFFPFLICIPFFLLNNCIFRITKIVKLLKLNALKIKLLNPDSRPFDIIDLEYLTDGIAGLQLQYSKWISQNLINKKIFDIEEIEIPQKKNLRTITAFSVKLPFKLINISRNLFNNLFTTFIWSIFLVLIYIIPLIIPAILIYNKKISNLFDNFIFPGSLIDKSFLIFCLLIIMTIYTLISKLLLYSFYFTELNELKVNLQTNGYSGLVRMFTKIINYYKQ